MQNSPLLPQNDGRHEGYIKFRIDFTPHPPPDADEIALLNEWRQRLYRLGYIGMYDGGIGFGNLSIRVPGTRQFIISGTKTGGLRRLEAAHYTLVNDFHIQNNLIRCKGMVKASSESLTHAAVYESAPAVNAVFHIHNQKLWQKYLHRLPSTAEHALYGTPAMAEEIRRILSDDSNIIRGVIVMAGHPEGIISFGSGPEEAGQRILNL